MEIVHRLAVVGQEAYRRHRNLDFEIRTRADVCSGIHLTEEGSVCADEVALAVDDCGCNERIFHGAFWTACVCTSLRCCYRFRERYLKADVVVTRDTYIGVCDCRSIVVLVDVGCTENIWNKTDSVTGVENIVLFVIGKDLRLARRLC